MKGIGFILAVLLFAYVAAEEKCCEECTKEKGIKYYSINTRFNRCGEYCTNPNKYYIYIFKICESGFTKAEVEHPCAEFGYTEFETTKTHTYSFLSITFDIYKKPE